VIPRATMRAESASSFNTMHLGLQSEWRLKRGCLQTTLVGNRSPRHGLHRG
jgi:hypothetical protein